MEEFLNVARSPAFLALPLASVSAALASDDLLIESEQDVFAAAIR
jgi:hypothetical protein